MLKAIIEEIRTRLDKLETEIKNIKWVVCESLKIAEQNENVIRQLSNQIEEVIFPVSVKRSKSSKDSTRDDAGNDNI